MPGPVSELHFLRPAWLLFLLPAAAVVWLLHRAEDPVRPFRNLIAPHLLEHLLMGRGRRFRLGAVHLVAAFLVLLTIALAGPTWREQDPPFAQDQAALVVALDLSRSMDAVDVAPSRLERAKQKVRDLLALRPGARTALVAYAGTAHSVLPLTEDGALLAAYLEALDTSLMPVPGKDPAAALGLAESLLAKETVPGTILFVTDGIARDQAPAFAQHRRSSRSQVVVLGVGTSQGRPALDREGLEALAREAGAFVATATLDDADVRRIQRGVQTHVQAVAQQDQGPRRRDYGWYLAPLLALAGGLWFRRGWTIRWASGLVAAAVLAGPAEAADFRLADLWATRDQQGRYYFERGDFKTAAERFRDPQWKGVACYRAGDYACAVSAFARADTPLAWYGLGNAYARSGEPKLAVAAYDQALAQRPGWPEAQANRDRVRALIPKPAKEDDEPRPADRKQKPDEAKLDDQGRKGKRAPVETKELADEQVARRWLRGVQTSPADFLRLRFAAEARKAGRQEGQSK
jgi:Ca-activated chloride channel homolog